MLRLLAIGWLFHLKGLTMSLFFCLISLIQQRCGRWLFAIEVLLNRSELAAIGARAMPKELENQGNMVGAAGIEPATPTMST